MKTITSFFIILILFANCRERTGSEIADIKVIQNTVPVFVNRSQNILFEISINIKKPETAILQKVRIRFSNNSSFEVISKISAVNITDGKTDFGTANQVSKKTEISGELPLKQGENIIQFNFLANEKASLLSTFSLKEIELFFENTKPVKIAADTNFKYRTALVLRSQGQDNCDTYRIPGLITTNNGTLIAVYDNRYNNSKDLQEDVDIGMSRSTDGGQTWEPMKVIMDMGEWGGLSQRLNGIGDPCILYANKTGTIWVGALWMSGVTENDMLWWASKPGISPEETGQFMLAKSTDDGLTWSEPVNITKQIKNPEWQLLLQGPGMGITMKDGTLVFPAQFKADIGEKALDGGQFTSHSTIVYSTDQGKTWQIGTGAKPNTTEAQVVELADGSLMLNMRDDLNRTDKSETNGRAVAVTTDLGKTWTIHPSSNSALQEPNCMASLIGSEIKINGKIQQVLFFSNPDSKTERNNMTIKASIDGGHSWPVEYQVLLNTETGYGYSCMTMVDTETIGIVYEGSKELYFQKLPVSDILKDYVK